MPAITALDTASGRMLWTTPEYPHGPLESVIQTGGGRVLVNLAGGTVQPSVLHVLETRTGRELWRTERGSQSRLSFPHGTLVAQQQPAGDLPGSVLTVLRAEDGSQLSQVPIDGTLQLFTDDGVAYAARAFPGPGQAWVTAVDTTDGERELLALLRGCLRTRLRVDEDQLYYAGVRQDPHVVASTPAGLAGGGSPRCAYGDEALDLAQSSHHRRAPPAVGNSNARDAPRFRQEMAGDSQRRPHRSPPAEEPAAERAARGSLALPLYTARKHQCAVAGSAGWPGLCRHLDWAVCAGWEGWNLEMAWSAGPRSLLRHPGIAAEVMGQSSSNTSHQRC